MAGIFKAYDIRGLYPEALNGGIARRIGRAFVRFNGIGKIVVGRDMRLHSPEVFAGTVETNLGIELSGYFIWNREAAEEIVSKTGGFDYFLPKNIRYSEGDSYVNLLSGVQSMNGKKICDLAENPKFSEAERCDTVSRLGAAFFNRRLKRFLPESNVYSVIFNFTKTDVSAFDKESIAKLVEVLCSSGESLSGHITNDTEKDLSTGLLYFSDETKKRITKYFG